MMNHCLGRNGSIICDSTVLVYNARPSSNPCIAVTGQRNGDLLQSQQIHSFVSGWNTCNPRNSKNVPHIFFPFSQPQQKPLRCRNDFRRPLTCLLIRSHTNNYRKCATLKETSALNNNNQIESQLKPKMTSIVADDALQAQVRGDLPNGVKIMPLGSFRVEKIGSMDQFKSKKLNFAALRPAVLLKDNLVLGRLRSEL